MTEWFVGMRLPFDLRIVVGLCDLHIEYIGTTCLELKNAF